MRRIRTLTAVGIIAGLMSLGGVGTALAVPASTGTRAKTYSGHTTQGLPITLTVSHGVAQIYMKFRSACSGNATYHDHVTVSGIIVTGGYFNAKGTHWHHNLGGGYVAYNKFQKLKGHFGRTTATGVFQIGTLIYRYGHLKYGCNTGLQGW